MIKPNQPPIPEKKILSIIDPNTGQPIDLTKGKSLPSSPQHSQHPSDSQASKTYSPTPPQDQTTSPVKSDPTPVNSIVSSPPHNNEKGGEEVQSNTQLPDIQPELDKEVDQPSKEPDASIESIPLPETKQDEIQQPTSEAKIEESEHTIEEKISEEDLKKAPDNIQSTGIIKIFFFIDTSLENGIVPEEIEDSSKKEEDEEEGDQDGEGFSYYQ